ncbi:HK97 family phage portal protein [Cupriavidus alkaliphilus]|uniref:phage portal protein n=1 Tax=Cupriavidus alkaliphilus TaxID=942866 RepID=UPI000DE6502E|nr:phage portal protein [Cupriavidus alkaliphilus]PVY81065.1 HK97 family phage portal protein [Cupriavidus alkaliphilus]
MKLNLSRVARGVRAAIDGFVRSFSLTDPELYNRTAAIEAGVEVTPKAVMQLDAVWSCVRLISETIATLPLSMYERTSAGKRVAPQHPLQFIIHDQPNADSTASVFWEAMVASMLLRGAGRAEKLYVSGSDQVVGLAYLDPDKLVCTLDFNTGRKKFTYPRPNGTLREIPEARIWTIPGFTLDGINGVSVIAYGAKVFGNAMAADKAAASTFSTGLLQTVYYKFQSFLNPQQRKEFRENLKGAVERGETPVMEGGSSVESVGIKPSDAQLLESRGYSVEAICRWFRVPPWMVGHTEKSTSWGTGIEQQMIGFLTFTLAPWLKRIEQAISKDLLRPIERARYYPKFAVEGLLRADSAGRAAFYGVMVDKGILTRDEVREFEERPPMGGNAAVLTVQSAMTTLDAIGAATAGDANQARASIRAFLGLEDQPRGTES